MRTVKGKFYVVKTCFKCGEQLSHRDLHSNGGVCPHCGHSVNGAVCRHNKHVYQEVLHQKRVLGLFWWTVKKTSEWKSVKLSSEGWS